MHDLQLRNISVCKNDYIHPNVFYLKALRVLFVWVCFAVLTQDMVQAEDADKVVFLFSGRSCGSCEVIENALKKHGIRYKYYNVDDIENYKLLVGFEEKLGQEAGELPALVYGKRVIGSRERILSEIDTVVTWYKKTGDTESEISTATDTTDVSLLNNAKERIETRYYRLDTVAIALAGLTDGINPCAFATIAFLVGCLAAGGRKRALYIGLSFAFGVFVTYLAVGLGLLQVLFALQGFAVLRKVFHWAALGMLLLAAGMSFFDAVYIKMNDGKPLFKMPKKLREKANITMARGIHSGRWLLAGMGLGVVVSLLELACTGQVYLPTILYVIQTGGKGAQPYLYLVLYNLMFIVPLLIVLVLCVKGMQAKKLWEVLHDRAALSRILIGLVFVLMFVALLVKP